MSSRGRKWKFRLKHITEAMLKIFQYTDSMTFEDFSNDPKTVDAVIRNFLIIGEAARAIPSDVEDIFAEIPWSDMRGMRNILAHEYESVDLSMVWNTIQDDLPPLLPLLEKVLALAED